MQHYRPQSPQLSYAPQSPDLTGRPQSPDLSGLQPQQPSYNPFQQQQQQSRHGGAFALNTGAPTYPTSAPQEIYQPQYQPPGMEHVKEEDTDYLPDAPPAKRPRGRPPGSGRNQLASNGSQAMPQPTSTQPSADPTLGVQLKTSFPVARIKRIMQADEDVGKVAQVTPHVVSRALELFMIKVISASAVQARGGRAAIKAEGASGAGGKGPKRILAQHMKHAIQADETLDFLQDIAAKVPDAPSKAKKEAASGGSDSEEVKPKRKGRKRKDSADD
ncbi:hypothetical protein B0A50_03237 [Salinomyces thailandicus]|uniref:Transcription factor CBF/NF-Y/archaeal histone domain-containing protein n=1 Tax=Salinomyces thailandicus TaxID=706561 RepID=A0A4U0U460_9PEZI|nr:hypothetical protein B0A50_03237 [Salinomyces thailandica]